MAQKKLIRFAAIKGFANVLEYPEGMQGKWRQHFNNINEIVLELACGRGEYTIGLGRLHPGKNFLGVDIKGNRMYIGAKKCLEEGLTNTGFLRTQIAMLPNYFAAAEVAEIWITFPDPQLRGSKAKKRLTHPLFLQLYQQMLQPGGFIHLKTDSPRLFEFTKQVIKFYNLDLVEVLDDVYGSSCGSDLAIKTHYESLDIADSKKIFYLKFGLSKAADFKDAALLEKLKQAENNLPTT